MPRLSHSKHRMSRLQVPHLTHQDDIGVLSEHVLQGLGEGNGISLKLPLGEGRLNVGMDVFYGVLYGDYVAPLLLIDVIYHSSQGGCFAATCRSADNNQSALGACQVPDLG